MNSIVREEKTCVGPDATTVGADFSRRKRLPILGEIKRSEGLETLCVARGSGKPHEEAHSNECPDTRISHVFDSLEVGLFSPVGPSERCRRGHAYRLSTVPVVSVVGEVPVEQER